MKRATISSLALLAALVASAANAGDHVKGKWDAEFVAYETVFQVLNVADAVQTLYVAEHPETYREAQSAWLIGDHPSTGEVLAFKAASAAIHYGVTALMVHADLKPGYIRAWQAVSIGWTAGTVAHNWSIGLKVKF